MNGDGTAWALEHLHEHLQLAIELELWTIPYYAAALTSPRDPHSHVSALLRSIVDQELAHLVALANIANAFGYSPQLPKPRYGQATLPHLCFDLDTPNPTSIFAPHSTALGPVDHPRLNCMCLIEYPAWVVGHRPLRQSDLADYTSVRELFDALGHGARGLREHIRKDRRQVADERFAALRISKDRAAGYEQVATLLDLVREQGEGARIGNGIPAHAPVIDDDEPELGATHFAKLNELRDGSLPEVWAGDTGEQVDASKAAARAEFGACVERSLRSWERRFAGDEGEALEIGLARILGAAGECWSAGVVPKI